MGFVGKSMHEWCRICSTICTQMYSSTLFHHLLEHWLSPKPHRIVIAKRGIIYFRGGLLLQSRQLTLGACFLHDRPSNSVKGYSRSCRVRMSWFSVPLQHVGHFISRKSATLFEKLLPLPTQKLGYSKISKGVAVYEERVSGLHVLMSKRYT